MVGFLIVLLAAFFFCFQNIIVRVLFNFSNILGRFETGGFVDPTLQSSLLLLVMRMLLVVPLMAVLIPKLHPTAWQDIRQLQSLQHRQLLVQSLGGGGLMFLYLALLYIAIGLIPTGIALTLFFTYPMFTALFSWQWFGDRPTRLRWLIMGLILLGSFLTIPQPQNPDATFSLSGIVAAVTAGIAYALYVVNAQKSLKTLHPIPFTWISFAVTLILSASSLMIWGEPRAETDWIPLWIGGIFSALVTFAGHVLNNIGIRQIGATSAAMVSATNPALTVVLAWLTIQETLDILQISGVLLVTLSVVLLSQERKFFNP
ncbi:MAG: EamA family transporter [Oscillatoriales cyanobacterium RM1_1_9]|nr:EamA family transporter [Oscillatoriales cyanobacterium SM2_3_0]NJO47461.1 EamA family transporter [Oscillatoriales cyanobacterium RM2_1_1]NJO70857.1 EamA family transporter [Oscillatoriales cyanobacterium RM1_1_9]